MSAFSSFVTSIVEVSQQRLERLAETDGATR
jgi:hypothetical protein